MDGFSADLNYDLGTAEKAQEITETLSTKIGSENVSVTCETQFVSVHVKAESSSALREAMLPIFDLISELGIK